MQRIEIGRIKKLVPPLIQPFIPRVIPPLIPRLIRHPAGGPILSLAGSGEALGLPFLNGSGAARFGALRRYGRKADAVVPHAGEPLNELGGARGSEGAKKEPQWMEGASRRSFMMRGTRARPIKNQIGCAASRAPLRFYCALPEATPRGEGGIASCAMGKWAIASVIPQLRRSVPRCNASPATTKGSGNVLLYSIAKMIVTFADIADSPISIGAAFASDIAMRATGIGPGIGAKASEICMTGPSLTSAAVA